MYEIWMSVTDSLPIFELTALASLVRTLTHTHVHGPRSFELGKVVHVIIVTMV